MDRISVSSPYRYSNNVKEQPQIVLKLRFQVLIGILTIGEEGKVEIERRKFQVLIGILTISISFFISFSSFLFQVLIGILTMLYWRCFEMPSFEFQVLIGILTILHPGDQNQPWLLVSSPYRYSNNLSK